MEVRFQPVRLDFDGLRVARDRTGEIALPVPVIARLVHFLAVHPPSAFTPTRFAAQLRPCHDAPPSCTGRHRDGPLYTDIGTSLPPRGNAPPSSSCSTPAPQTSHPSASAYGAIYERTAQHARPAARRYVALYADLPADLAPHLPLRTVRSTSAPPNTPVLHHPGTSRCTRISPQTSHPICLCVRCDLRAHRPTRPSCSAPVRRAVRGSPRRPRTPSASAYGAIYERTAQHARPAPRRYVALYADLPADLAPHLPLRTVRSTSAPPNTPVHTTPVRRAVRGSPRRPRTPSASAYGAIYERTAQHARPAARRYVALYADLPADLAPHLPLRTVRSTSAPPNTPVPQRAGTSRCTRISPQTSHPICLCVRCDLRAHRPIRPSRSAPVRRAVRGSPRRPRTPSASAYGAIYERTDARPAPPRYVALYADLPADLAPHLPLRTVRSTSAPPNTPRTTPVPRS